jgi:hypothetical protein
MNRIEAIYWDQIPADGVPSWVESSGALLALWPSPVDADACFARAGFCHFRDSDEQWDREWSEAIQRLLDALGSSFGPAEPQGGNDVYRVRRRGWRDWLMPWQAPAEPVELSTVERVALSTQDDRFDDSVAHFGKPRMVTLRAGKGHPLLWVAGAPGAALFGEALARAMAEERPVVRRQLQWSYLI